MYLGICIYTHMYEYVYGQSHARIIIFLFEKNESEHRMTICSENALRQLGGSVVRVKDLYLGRLEFKSNLRYFIAV